MIREIEVDRDGQIQYEEMVRLMCGWMQSECLINVIHSLEFIANFPHTSSALSLNVWNIWMLETIENTLLFRRRALVLYLFTAFRKPSNTAFV
jgi:hypothetical protein